MDAATQMVANNRMGLLLNDVFSGLAGDRRHRPSNRNQP